MSKRKVAQAAQDAIEEGEASEDEEENAEDPGDDGIAKDNALLSDEDPTSSDEDLAPLQDTPPGERRLPVDPYKRSGSADLTQWTA